MKRRIDRIFGNDQQRGFRLRCFLSKGTLLALAFSATIQFSSAQLTIEKPLHLSHVQGVVADRAGKPISNAKLELVTADQAVISATATNPEGQFQFERVEGKFVLRVSSSAYATATRDVTVEPDATSLFSGSKLYVMLWPSGCMDDCSLITASRKKFDHSVRWNTGHYD